MQPIGTTQAQFLRLGERSALEIGFDRGYVLFRRPFLPGGERVRRHRVDRTLQHRHPCGHQLFIPAGQSAVTQQRLQQSGETHGQGRGVGHGLEHVRHDAALLQQGIVQNGELGRDLLPLEHRNAALGFVFPPR